MRGILTCSVHRSMIHTRNRLRARLYFPDFFIYVYIYGCISTHILYYITLYCFIRIVLALEYKGQMCFIGPCESRPKYLHIFFYPCILLSPLSHVSHCCTRSWMQSLLLFLQYYQESGMKLGVTPCMACVSAAGLPVCVLIHNSLFSSRTA